MADFISAAQVFLAVVLATAGILKLRDRTAFELAISRLVEPAILERLHVDSRRAANATCAAELAVAAWLVVPAFPAARGAAVGALFTVFLAAVARALRLHVACGCYGGRRPSEVADLVRATILAALAWAVAAATWTGAAPGAVRPGIAAAVWLLPIVAVTLGAPRLAQAALRRGRPPDVGSTPMLSWDAVEYVERRFNTPRLRPAETSGEIGISAVGLARALRLPVSTLLLAAIEHARQQGPPPPSPTLSH